MCASTCYLIGAIAFLAKIVIDIETRYRLLETIREYGEERLDEAGETDRWRARHADYYVGVLQQIRHHDRRDEVFWAVRLSAKQDNLLAAWSWAIDTRNIDTAFSILAGFAPSELSFRWPLLLDGEAALELPGAAAHPGYDAVPSRCVYLGDAVTDVVAGRAAGMATIAVTWGAATADDLAGAGPTAVISNVAELAAQLLTDAR